MILLETFAPVISTDSKEKGDKEKGDRFIFTTIISATAHAKPLKANNSLNQSSLPRASRSLLTVSALEPLCSEN